MTLQRSAVAIRHVAFEDLGILAPLLDERGYHVSYLDAGVDPMSTCVVSADLLIVLGGPIGAYECDRYPHLRHLTDALAARLHVRRPTLGVCLGAQLMATALGAQVEPAATGSEIGFAAVELTPQGESSCLSGLRDTPVLHWHGDQFAIPEGAARLASTPRIPNQAFSIGPNILGLQFHLEMNHEYLERWLIGHAHELATHGTDIAQLRMDAARVGPQLADRARQVFANWIDHLTPAEILISPVAEQERI